VKVSDRRRPRPEGRWVQYRRGEPPDLAVQCSRDTSRPDRGVRSNFCANPGAAWRSVGDDGRALGPADSDRWFGARDRRWELGGLPRFSVPPAQPMHDLVGLPVGRILIADRTWSAVTGARRTDRVESVLQQESKTASRPASGGSTVPIRPPINPRARSRSVVRSFEPEQAPIAVEGGEECVGRRPPTRRNLRGPFRDRISKTPILPLRAHTPGFLRHEGDADADGAAHHTLIPVSRPAEPFCDSTEALHASTDCDPGQLGITGRS